MKTKLIQDGVSDFVFEALKDDEYDAGKSDFTPSSLNEPSFKRALEKSIPDEVVIEVKASWLIAIYMGTGVHKSMELFAKKHPERYDAERRFYGTVQTKYGPKLIGAQVDIWDKKEKKITDGKVTKTYSVSDGPKDDWIQQLNVQMWCIWKETGVIAESLEIAGFFKDHTEHNLGRQNYPALMQTPVKIEQWTFPQIRAWIVARVESHLEAEWESAKNGIDSLPHCTPNERWKRDDVYAVMKAGGKRSLKNCGTEKEALDIIETKGPNHYIDHRLGEDVRCQPKFCNACEHCWYYKSKQK